MTAPTEESLQAEVDAAVAVGDIGAFARAAVRLSKLRRGLEPTVDETMIYDPHGYLSGVKA